MPLPNTDNFILYYNLSLGLQNFAFYSNKKEIQLEAKKRCLIQLIRPKGEKIKNKSDDQVSNVEKIQIKHPTTIIKPYPNFNATKWWDPIVR
jgi:hypothetical protein